MSLKLYELVPRVADATTAANVSPHVWKTKLDLAILGLQYEVVGQTFPQIRGPLATQCGDDAVTVPTIEADGEYVTDSWKIAEWLEQKYNRSLFGSLEGKAFAKFLEIWGNTDLGDTIRPLVAPKFYTIQDHETQAYFLKVKFGGDEDKLSEMVERLSDATWVSAQTASARAKLQLVESHLAALKTPFLAGTSPSHADAVVFGWYGFSQVNKEAAEQIWNHESLPHVNAWVGAILATGVAKNGFE